MNKIVIALILVLAGVYVVTRVKAKGCKLIPRKVLFGNAAKRMQLRISPLGNFLTYVAPVDDVMNIWLKSFDSDDDQPITYDKNRGITHGYWWAYDESKIFYMQDQNGDENWKLYSVNIADKKVVSYIPFDGVQVQLIDYNKDFPERMLIGINKRDPRLHDAYELNLNTNELKLIAENTGEVVEWLANSDLEILGKIELKKTDGSYVLSVRETVNAPWRELGIWTAEEEVPGIYYFSKDGNYFYASDSRNSNTSRFVKIDVKTGETIPLASDPEYDISGELIADFDTFDPLAIGYSKDRRHWIFFDAATEDTFSQLRALDQGDITVGSRTLDNSKWTVGFSKDDGPVSFWIIDRQTQKKKFIFDHQPVFKNYILAPMEPIEFHARDGLLIHGYITYPCGKERKNLPLVLNVHGGPWTRDTWGFNPEVQWLANRGYAVLQVNYRGSKGYGKKFLNAGYKQWGRAMQDDLTDAVHWAVNEGIADKNRVAIYGASYGGYAALAGATFTPDLYRCAVDVVGVSNIFSFINSIPPYWEVALVMFKNRVGDIEQEQEFLKSISPLYHVDAIKIPILIAQGANDPRVKQAESEQIVEALKAKGLEYEYLLFPDEGHGFVKPDNKFKFYKAAEAFLAKYLGGSYEA